MFKDMKRKNPEKNSKIQMLSLFNNNMFSTCIDYGYSQQCAYSRKNERKKERKKERKRWLAKQGLFKGGQSSNYLDKTGGTSLGKLIKMAFNLGSWLPLEMKAHFLFGLLRFFK